MSSHRLVAELRREAPDHAEIDEPDDRLLGEVPSMMMLPG